MAAPPRKYLTKQERKAAVRAANLKWRQANPDYFRNYHKGPLHGPTEPRKQIPSQVLEAQQRRLDAENRRNLTASVFGDPPPGFSALDKKNGKHPS